MDEWAIWRLPTSEFFRGQQVTTIMNDWNLDMLSDANDVLDAIEEAQARASKKAQG